MKELDLVFVGGAPRSGTTLLQRILNGHSEIYGGPEFDHIPDIMLLRDRIQSGIASGRISSYLDAPTADRAVSEFVRGLVLSKVKGKGVRIVSEKTPSNAKVLRQLLEVFPESKCLMIVRDPRAVVASLLDVGKRHKSAGSEVPTELRNALNAIGTYNSHVAPFLEIASDPRLFFIHYEDLVESPEAVIKKVFQFIGVEFEKEALAVSENTFSFADVGTEHFVTPAQVNSNIESIYLEKWRRELSRRDIDIINRFCIRANVLERYHLGPRKITPQIVGFLIREKLKVLWT